MSYTYTISQKNSPLNKLFYNGLSISNALSGTLVGEENKAKEYGVYDYKMYVKNHTEYEIYRKITDKISVLYQIYQEAKDSADYKDTIKEHLENLKAISGIKQFISQNNISTRSSHEFCLRLSQLFAIQPFIPLLNSYEIKDPKKIDKSKITDSLTSFAMLVNRHLSFGPKDEENKMPSSWQDLIEKGMIALAGNLQTDVLPVVENYCSLTSKNLFKYQLARNKLEICDTIYKVSIDEKISIPVYASTLTTLTAEKSILLIPNKNYISKNLLLLINAILSKNSNIHIDNKKINFPKQNVIVLRISENECQNMEYSKNILGNSKESNILRCSTEN
ncbi:MAG: hypothetical protein COX81_02525 [Candidatus Magasanikbacteria bacterium CG_4_10_14_0_2_um_filter_37_12]|uniref:Uncharacterized protein n=1 Tax=Candidatus Magasanikbacteria bacterium CG_4_10_14_0_2_um_filter_37_12 TaxID=1974637 RepID=A0A2M7V7T1_9BACT|nr:MAG: hypothetical protein COX81_02525 [Candidatus Magasanikbacteria bacterium CG_4_10_14_0_2_um_filter_37_12]